MDTLTYLNDLTIEVETLDLIRKHCKDIQEMDKLNLKIKEKEDLIYRCKNNLSKLSDKNICCRLYLHMLDGLSVSKAIETVSQENYVKGIKPTSITALWKYYKKLQKMLKV